MDYQDSLSPEPYDYAAPPKKDKKTVLIVVLIVLVALLAAVGAVAVLGARGVLDIPFLRAQEEPSSVAASSAATTAPPETQPETTVQEPVFLVPETTTAAPAVTSPVQNVSAGQVCRLEESMRLREGPGTGYGYDQVIPAGTDVTVVSVVGDWLNVSYINGAGWIYGPSAFRSWWQGGGDDAEPTVDPAAVYPYNAAVKSAMKLRTGPGIDFGAKTVIPADSVVTVYEKQMNPAGELWARVAYNGVEGWIRVKESGV